MNEWTIGMLFSLLVGGVITWLFLEILRSWLGVPPKPRLSKNGKAVPPWLTGMAERLFFTVLIGLGVSGVPTSMMGWLGLKLATNWNHPDWKNKPNARTFALSALLGGIVSLLFATLGGLVCKGELWANWLASI